MVPFLQLCLRLPLHLPLRSEYLPPLLMLGWGFPSQTTEERRCCFETEL